MTDRLPPNATEAEAMLLSALLLDPGLDTFDAVEPVLRAEHFYGAAHQRIYSAIQALAAEGQPTGLTTVAAWLQDHKQLDGIGGSRYLAELTDSVPAVADSAATLARSIRDAWRLREVITTCRRLESKAYQRPEDVDAFAQEVEGAIFAATEDRTREARQRGAERLVADLLEDIRAKRSGEKPHGLSWGWSTIDERVGALVPGEFYVFAGRPGTGKTGFATQLARHVATKGGGVAFASLEMSRAQLTARFAAQAASLDTGRVSQGLLGQAEFDKLVGAAPQLGKLPIEVDDTPRMTVAQLRSLCRRANRIFGRRKKATKLDLLVLDHLGFVGDDDLPPEKRKNDNSAIGEKCARIKALAKDFEIPVFVVSHLNRKCEERPNKRPRLSDLRDSGNIEQDAYQVCFLYRADKYRKRGEKPDRMAELHWAKNRNGPEVWLTMLYTEHSAAFVQLAPEEQDTYDDEPAEAQPDLPVDTGPNAFTTLPGAAHD